MSSAVKDKVQFKVAKFRVRGTSTFVSNVFRQTCCSCSPSEPASFEDRIHRSQEGWCGIPAVAFYKAMVSASRAEGAPWLGGIAVVRRSLFVLQDGWSQDPADRSGLVKITKGKPEKLEITVRASVRTSTTIQLPAWPAGWEAQVRVRYDLDALGREDVKDLLMRAGMQVGVGEGRPDSRSGGQGWGLFEIVER